MFRTLSSWALLVAGAIAISRPSAAQTSADSKAVAESLFDEGLALMKQRRLEEACPKLEQSQRIDPGIGNLLYLAECYELSGRTASAWATFREAASSAAATGETARAKDGQARADRLAPQLSKLTINVDRSNGSVSGFEVSRAGEKLSPTLWGTAVPVDPGTWQVIAAAPGYHQLTLSVSVGSDGARAVLEIPALKPMPAPLQAATPAPTSPPPALALFHNEPTGESAATNSSYERTYGLILMGVGVAGVGVGSVFGIQAIHDNNRAKRDCDGRLCLTESGKQASDAAKKAALGANIGVLGGAAVLLGGAVLYFIAPSDAKHAQVSLRPSQGGAELSLEGSF